ncbi:MAG TPA: Asp23/Gls24 family envelope stress response protein [Gaiellales bacterium]|jgi:uncharacterized alkaline shock family protein YloU|nr:Asp23/Gls24 family envelope stress response protein [Gaiellales bacterium]
MSDATGGAPAESVHSAGVAAHISHAVIATYAAAAAREVEGVHALAGGGFGPLERRAGPERTGVRVVAGDRGIDLELHLVTAWGASIPAVAASVEQAVRAYLESMVALEVGSVAVHVDDVAEP